MVTPAARREGAAQLMARRGLSERRACRLVGISRSVRRYVSRRDDAALSERLRTLATEYPRYGYPLLHGLLAAEGLVVHRKRTYRLYRAMGGSTPL